MSLLAEYFKETGHKNVIESEKGFATYYYMAEGCYVEDIFVIPACRRDGIASQMLDQIAEIAKANGVTKLIGSCVPSSNNSTASLKAAFDYGFTLHSSKENLIVYVKEIV